MSAKKYTDSDLRAIRDTYLPRSPSIVQAMHSYHKDGGPPPINARNFRTRFAGLFGDTPGKYLKDKAAPLPSAAKGHSSLSEQIASSLAGLPKHPASAKLDGGVTAVLCLSDLHFGQLDSGRLVARLRSVVSDFLSFAVRPDLEEIVVLLLGDIHDGLGIYPGQVYEIDRGPAQQVMLSVRELWAALVSLSAHAPVRAECVAGNHGNVLGKKHPLSSGALNWDLLAYEILDLVARMHDHDIRISYTREPMHFCDLRGTRGALIHHAPAQIETAARRRRVADWADIHEFDWLASGHLHEASVAWYNDRPLIRCGALSDPNSFSTVEVARRSRPHQICWLATDVEPVNDLRVIWP